MSFATMRRTNGAITSTAGKATAQELAQLSIHALKNPSLRPSTRPVAMPETTSDMRPDKRNPNRMGAKRGGIMRQTILDVRYPRPCGEGLCHRGNHAMGPQDKPGG